MGNKFVVLLIGAALASQDAVAKTIYFGGAIETVPVSYGSTTILRFEEPVKMISNAADFIIKPANDESPDYATLSVEPRITSGKVDAVFILMSGETAKLKLSVVPRQAGVKVEPIYELKSQKALIESRAASTPYIGRIDLMTAMIRGDKVTGYESQSPKKEISGGPGSVKVVLEKTYSGEEFKGYVYEVKNQSRHNHVTLDVRKIQFGSPNQAVLAYADLDILEQLGSKKEKTRLLVVTKATSAYRDAVLPIRVKPVTAKAEGEP